MDLDRIILKHFSMVREDANTVLKSAKNYVILRKLLLLSSSECAIYAYLCFVAQHTHSFENHIFFKIYAHF